MENNKQPMVSVQLTEQEKHVIELIRNIGYGEIRIVVNASKPIRAEEIRKSVQL